MPFASSHWIGPFLAATVLVGARPAVLGSGAYHRTPLDAPESTNLPNALLTNAPVRQISNGLYALGRVRFETATRIIRFPGTVNMREGLVEYALVRSTGKVHESVLKTDADPLHIHLARLLLAAKTGAPPSFPSSTPNELRGIKAEIWVSWKTNGAETRLRIEDLIQNTLTQRSMRRGDWIYNGSRVAEGAFLAQRDGSIVAIIADPDALVNNPRPGRDDDEIWKPNAERLPPVGTPVEVTLQLKQDS